MKLKSHNYSSLKSPIIKEFIRYLFNNLDTEFKYHLGEDCVIAKFLSHKFGGSFCISAEYNADLGAYINIFPQRDGVRRIVRIEWPLKSWVNLVDSVLYSRETAHYTGADVIKAMGQVELFRPIVSRIADKEGFKK